MSVGLFKYEGDIYDVNSKLILSRNIASERKYYEYLDVAIKELDIKKFKDGAELRKHDLFVVLDELEKLIAWVKSNVEGENLEYFLPRLEEIKEILPKYLKNENDIIYIF